MAPAAITKITMTENDDCSVTEVRKRRMVVPWENKFYRREQKPAAAMRLRKNQRQTKLEK